MATLTIANVGTTNFISSPEATNVTDIVFATPGPGSSTAQFEKAQFGPGLISTHVHITGDAFQNEMNVFVDTGEFSAIAWTFENWGSNDIVRIRVNLTGPAIVTGSARSDIIELSDFLFTGGIAQIDAAGGDDQIRIDFAAPIAGNTIQGAGGSDSISIAKTLVDLTSVVIGGVEKLSYASAGKTAILNGDQFGTVGVEGISQVEAVLGGSSGLIVRDEFVDLSDVEFLNWGADDVIAIEGTSSVLNVLIGSSQADQISSNGPSPTNSFTGGGGADILLGGGGTDFFTYLAGIDLVAGEVIEGGAGTDTIDLENAGTVNFAPATITGVEALRFHTGSSTASFESDQIGNLAQGFGDFSTVFGSPSVDAIVVSAVGQAATLSGLTFVDWTDGVDTITINGSGLPDNIGGSQKGDLINGGGGADVMAGFAGNDTYVVDNTGDTVMEAGGSGTDTVQSTVTFALAAEVENLTLTGAAAINGTGNGIGNVITGNSAPNTLAGLGGNDTLNGAGGTDTASYAGAAAGVTVSLAITTAQNTVGDGTDTLSSMENLTGSNFADTLTGNSGDNTLSGGNENDTLNGGSGNDTLNGGAGFDTASYADAGAGVTVSLNVGTAQNTGGAGTDTLSSVERLIGSSFGDTLTGTSGDNILSGGNGVDTLNGEGGGDRLDGGIGSDAMAGGNGNDTYVADAVGDTITEAANFGIDTVESSVTHTLAANVENLTLTGTAGTNGTGNSLVNTITGNAGINRIDGGAGNDSMIGGNGNDTYVVDSASDVITEGANFGVDTVESSVSFTLAANVDKLTLTGSSGTNGTGNSLVNTITGNSGANRIDGGGAGDTMIGGNGNDTYVVDSVADVITEASGAGTGTDAVESSISHTLAANVENLTLTGAAGTNGTGNGLANTIIGNSGANRIDGDALNDTLTGGGGNDDFVFDDGDGADTVTDFQNGNDQFDLSAVAGVNNIGDLTIIDNGATVTVNYGTGSFTITNLADPAQLDAGDFLF